MKKRTGVVEWKESNQRNKLKKIDLLFSKNFYAIDKFFSPIHFHHIQLYLFVLLSTDFNCFSWNSREIFHFLEYQKFSEQS